MSFLRRKCCCNRFQQIFWSKKFRSSGCELIPNHNACQIKAFVNCISVFSGNVKLMEFFFICSLKFLISRILSNTLLVVTLELTGSSWNSVFQAQKYVPRVSAFLPEPYLLRFRVPVYLIRIVGTQCSTQKPISLGCLHTARWKNWWPFILWNIDNLYSWRNFSKLYEISWVLLS